MKNFSYFTGEQQHQYTDDHLNPFFSDWLDGITQNENALKPSIQQNHMSTTLELTQAIHTFNFTQQEASIQQPLNQELITYDDRTNSENISSVLSSSLIDSSQSIPIDQNNFINAPSQEPVADQEMNQLSQTEFTVATEISDIYMGSFPLPDVSSSPLNLEIQWTTPCPIISVESADAVAQQQLNQVAISHDNQIDLESYLKGHSNQALTTIDLTQIVSMDYCCVQVSPRASNEQTRKERIFIDDRSQQDETFASNHLPQIQPPNQCTYTCFDVVQPHQAITTTATASKKHTVSDTTIDRQQNQDLGQLTLNSSDYIDNNARPRWSPSSSGNKIKRGRKSGSKTDKQNNKKAFGSSSAVKNTREYFKKRAGNSCAVNKKRGKQADTPCKWCPKELNKKCVGIKGLKRHLMQAHNKNLKDLDEDKEDDDDANNTDFDFEINNSDKQSHNDSDDDFGAFFLVCS